VVWLPFLEGGLSATRAAGRFLKQAFAEVEPPTAAEDMREQWLPWWSPAPLAGRRSSQNDPHPHDTPPPRAPAPGDSSETKVLDEKDGGASTY
jgi:hypothetical protein